METQPNTSYNNQLNKIRGQPKKPIQQLDKNINEKKNYNPNPYQVE